MKKVCECDEMGLEHVLFALVALKDSALVLPLFDNPKLWVMMNCLYISNVAYAPMF